MSFGIYKYYQHKTVLNIFYHIFYSILPCEKIYSNLLTMYHCDMLTKIEKVN